MSEKVNNMYPDIAKEKFQFASSEGRLHDQKLETKPVGFFKDAFRRFRKNKGSVIAAYIILLLVIFAIVGPYFIDAGYTKAYETQSPLIKRYQFLPPKVFNAGTGFWDGTKDKEINAVDYYRYMAMEQELGCDIVTMKDSYKVGEGEKKSTMYLVNLDMYNSLTPFEVNLTPEEYTALQNWQDENGLQVILPYVNRPDSTNKQDPVAGYDNDSVWYECTKAGVPTFVTDSNGERVVDENGNYVFVPAYYTKGTDKYESAMRLQGDPALEVIAKYADIEDAEAREEAIKADSAWAKRWRYAKRNVTMVAGETIYSYQVRVNSYNYFRYKFGFEPKFIFGTDTKGYDIFTRLASGARFSFILAICVSAINLFIGTIYGAIEGYYGGAVDMIMERTSDILSGIPSTVVTILFQLHLAAKVGTVGALVYAFILTGWIGMASSVRMQFYRFKNQEYVLAARTLGARDLRVMFKHIFPNSLGTLITGCVLVIPGVIFSETSLTYLGIVNLEGTTQTSVGAMLSAGQKYMTKYPHVILFPAIFIALLMICFNLFGNGLRDAFNPSLRGTED